MERLFVAEVAQFRNFCQLLLYFSGIAQYVVVLRTGGCDLDHGRRSEVQDLAHEVSWVKREMRSGKLLRQRLTQLLFQISERNGRTRLESDIQDCFVGSARPQEHRIDRIGRPLCADVAQCEVHVAGASLAVDDIEHLPRHLFGHRHTRAIRCVKTKAELIGSGRRKNLSRQVRRNQHEHEGGQYSVGAKQDRRAFRHPV